MVLDDLDLRGFVLTKCVADVYSDKELYKLENNTTIFAIFGLLVFPLGSYVIEKLASNKLIPSLLIDLSIFSLLTLLMIYPVVMIQYLNSHFLMSLYFMTITSGLFLK